MDSCGLICSTRIFVVFIHILMVSVYAICSPPFFSSSFINSYSYHIDAFLHIVHVIRNTQNATKSKWMREKKKDYCGRERNRIWRKWDNHNQLPRLFLNVVILIHHLRLNQGFVIMDGTIIWSLMCTAIMLFLDISLKSILFSIIINTRLR